MRLWAAAATAWWNRSSARPNPWVSPNAPTRADSSAVSRIARTSIGVAVEAARRGIRC
jgi:hypothetical protein